MEVCYCALEGMRCEPEGYDAVSSLELLLGQAVDEAVASGTEDVGLRRFCHSCTKTGLERLRFKRVFGRVEAVECSVFKSWN